MCGKSACWLSVALVLGIVAATTAQNIDPSLVGWWTFDEGAGNVAGDLSGKSVAGTLVNGPTWGFEGDHRGVLQFDGVDDYVFIDGHFNLPVYTMSLWFRVDGGSGARDIISAYAVGVQHGILLELQGDGQLRYLHRYPLGTGGGSNIRVATATYDDNTWRHVAMVKAENRITLFINGEEVGTAGDTSEFNPGDTFGIALGILDDERTPQRHLPGAIDDVRIYDRPMTAEEIQATMELEVWPFAFGPDPADGALLPATWVNLKWASSPLAVSHDVYLGENFDDVNNGTGDTFRGNQTDTTLIAGFMGFPIPDGLVPGTTYYWRVDEVDPANPDSPWKGSVWSFLVPPKKAYNPIPVEGSKFIDPGVELNWTPGYDAKLHTVYFGDNFDEVSNAADGAAQGTTTFAPGALEPGRTYYW
ncbi:MAG TPA: LamG domain-containing protein, partial [Phycisphaerales bacterium]|nr:LamG domain-containing protein [Phycisphaerales bacterium]